MTYNDKLRKLKSEIFDIQRSFLTIVQSIRIILKNGNILDDDIISRKDDIFYIFVDKSDEYNNIKRYISDNKIDMDSEYFDI